jgi:predicted metal-dependent phosphoesterase TrpH
MHTTTSDGLATVEDLLAYVARRGQLDVIAITDHDRLESSLWAYERRDFYPFDIIPGVEVTSTEGHVLGLWVMQPIPRKLSLVETVIAIHEQGGVAILAHPFHFHMLDVARNFMHYLREPEMLIAVGLDGIEAHNAGVVTPLSNKLARRMARRLAMPVTGSSDAHSLGAIGSGVTRFPGHSSHELRTALASGKTIAQGRPWSLSDYLEIARALPHWKGNRPGETDSSLPLASGSD